MANRLIKHIQGNAIAYVALFFAIGGGGGYAIASTVSSGATVRLCIAKSNGAVSVHAKCAKTQRTVLVNQRGVQGVAGKTGATGATGPQGTPASTSFGTVGSNPTSSVVIQQQGMTITQTSTGVYTVTITGACAGETSTLQVSPYGQALANGNSAGPPSVTDDAAGNSTFTVYAGNVENGSVVPTTQGFTAVDVCPNA